MAAPGRIIDGRYVVEAELGSGGMGVVLKVRHRFTGAQHALKMLRPDFALDTEAQNRFLAEARAATAIGHHGIVQVLDAGKTPEGELYLVMELLTGQPLRTALVRTGMTPQHLRQVGLELLDALGAAHARGFVHRDLKPENVFLVAPNGTAKLLDFGIAKIAQGINMTSAPRTAAGVVLGTLAYMAPEQLHDARSVDPRADLWALGVMFFEMISGRLPWPQRTMTELYIALESEEPTKIEAVIPNAAPQLVAFFARALARDPKHRFQSTAEMAAALAALPMIAGAPNGNMTQATGAGAWSQPRMPMTQQTGDTMYPSVAPAQTPYPPAVAQRHPPTGPPPALALHTPYPAPAPPPIAQPTPYPPAGPPPIAQTLNHAPPVAGHHSKTLLAVGLAVVAIGLIVTAVVIATRGNSHTDVSIAEDKPLPEKHIVDKMGQRIEVPPPPPPAAKQPDPPPVDPRPAKTIVPKKPPPQQPAPQQPAPQQPAPQQPAPQQPQAPQSQMISGVTREQFCTAACKGASACGFAPGNCMQGCVFDQPSVTCVSTVKNCNDLAACVYQTGCNARPVGNASCGIAMGCQASCGNDPNCACRCAGQMSINHAQLLLQLDICVGSCGNNQQCLVRCQPFATQCLSQ